MSTSTTTTTATTVTTSWTKLDPRPDPIHGIPCTRSSHGLSIVKNGTRLILHGGEHVARTPLPADDATWIADYNDDDDRANANPSSSSSSSWQWRRLELPSPKDSVVPPPRLAHAQAVYQQQDGIVYMFGGRAGIGMDELPMNDLWKLDASGPPGTETWTRIEPNSNTPPPPEPRSFHRMVCIGTKLYVFGGCGVHGRLADLHAFDVETNTWQDLGSTSLLRGRGGANLLSLASGTVLGVVAGFAGEETNDGHLFDIEKQVWYDHLMNHDEDNNHLLQGLRPRSVCVSGSFPSVGVAIIFGGEVDPSQKGHEGAGDFANDVVVLDEATGKHLETIPPPPEAAGVSSSWPTTRGWSDAASWEDGSNDVGHLFIFGGLTGDDANPIRLNDLWRLDITKKTAEEE